MITFGEWLPDQPDMNNAIVTANNVIPAANGYRSLPSFTQLSTSASNTLLGIYSAKADDATISLFAGDSTRLYEFNTGTSGLDDVSNGTYSLEGKERWKFVQYGNDVIVAGGIGEELQYWDLATSTQFATLSTDAPKADYIAVVRDFIFTANIDEGSGRKPYRVKWSGFDSATDWTAGTNQSDFQDIPDAGAIQGIVGGEFATIFMEKAIVRATYTGLPLVFQFDKVEPNRGCKIAGSICNIGQLSFYYSDSGFYMWDGQQSKPIGQEKVDDFFNTDCDFSYINKITSAVDPIRQIAVWSYVSTSNTGTTPDKLLIYNYYLDRWSSADVDSDLVAPFFTASYSLEDLDNVSTNLDTIPASLDSSFWLGGEFYLGGALADQMYVFSGAVLDGTVETGELPLAAGKHNLVTRIYPYYDGGSVTLQVGTRDALSDSVTFTSAVSPNTDNFANFRAQGRYHRLRMSITGEWDLAQGIDVEAREIGRR